MFKSKNKVYYITPYLETFDDSLNVLLHWKYNGDFAEPIFTVFVDGQEYMDTTNLYCLITNALPGVCYSYDVIAQSQLEYKTNDLSSYIYSVPKGNRLELSFKNPIDRTLEQNKDFKAYQFYMSNDGSDPSTLLAETGTPVYLTDPLQDGTTYKFKARGIDATGNPSPYGPVVTATVNSLPEACTNPSISYSQATRQATLTAATGTQDADCIGYALYSNHLPGWSLQPDLVDVPLKWYSVGDTLTFTTPELFAGDWIFGYRAVDQTGLKSPDISLTLSLVMSGSNLVIAPVKPSKPVAIDADPLAGGAIKVSVSIADTTNLTKINVYRDGSLDGFVNVVQGTLSYTYNTSVLTNGQTYTFTATSYNGTLESVVSDSVSCMSDSVPPTGDFTLTCKLVS